MMKPFLSIIPLDPVSAEVTGLGDVESFDAGNRLGMKRQGSRTTLSTRFEVARYADDAAVPAAVAAM